MYGWLHCRESHARRPSKLRQTDERLALSRKDQVGGPKDARRPELYWDRNGRLTGSEQFIKAVTTTLEYKFPYLWTNTIARLEYRYDESRGASGGFYKGGEVAPGVIGLTPAQHLLIAALIWTFDSP